MHRPAPSPTDPGEQQINDAIYHPQDDPNERGEAA
jgi:hypothetical protein